MFIVAPRSVQEAFLTFLIVCALCLAFGAFGLVTLPYALPADYEAQHIASWCALGVGTIFGVALIAVWRLDKRSNGRISKQT